MFYRVILEEMTDKEVSGIAVTAEIRAKEAYEKLASTLASQGKPSGHFRRTKPGESPFVSKFLR